MKKIISLIDNELIKVITGVRRCGKSYMLNLIIEELIKRGINEKNIIKINFDIPPYNREINTRELDLIVKDLTSEIDGKIYLFFDEIQNVDKWERSIIAYKELYNCDIYITGSNSKMLSGELATHLTGRYIQIKMYPFSFKEFLEYKNDNLTPKEILFDEYIKYGGMPHTLATDVNYKLEYLNDLFRSIYSKDIVERYNIRDSAILKRLIEFIFDNIGKIFSANTISKYLKENNLNYSQNTIYSYLQYLEDACLIYKVKREDVEGKKLFKLNEKYYVVDQGFCEALIGKNQLNVFRLIESIVYFELLRRGYEVTVGYVGKLEVDFLCKSYNKRIYVQVCYILSSEKTVEREFKPLEAIKDNYPKYVISTDKFDFSRNGIIHLNLIDFLLDESVI